MPPDSPLAAKPYVTAADLEDKPLLLPRRLNVQSELASWFGSAFDRLNVLFTSNLPSNSAVMVYNKLAYALIVEGSIRFWDKRWVVCRPLYPELTAACTLAWKRRQPFGLAASTFIAHVKKALYEKEEASREGEGAAHSMPAEHASL